MLIKDDHEARELIQVALGRIEPDMVITNARLLNVYTGEFLDDISIRIKGKWIADVGRHVKTSDHDNATVIELKGQTVIPGLIDGHTHLAWIYSPQEFLKYCIPGGTTTIITETLEPFPVAGLPGVIDFLNSYRSQPIKILGTAPYMASISRRARGISAQSLEQLLNHDRILGLGESYWQSVLQDQDASISLFQETLKAGKTLEGHTAGARDAKLSAYVAAGISSCHEPIKAEEVLERLRLGLYVMIREGSIRRDLEAISEILRSDIDYRRLILTTDGIEPVDLVEKGYMEYVVQKAIDLGFEPETAIQMATLNVAQHFSLDHLVGGIAPGRYADLLIIPDERTIKPEYVISNGRIIARNGRLSVEPKHHAYSDKSRETIHLKQKISPSDFRIPAKGRRTRAMVRVIKMITDLVTQEKTMMIPVTDQEIKPDIKKDVIKVAAIDRTFVPGKSFTGLITGFKMRSGAVACSAAWDSSNIIIVGCHDQDMAAAANRIHETQGGVVVCDQGKVIAELPLPVFGLISTETLPQIIKKTKQIRTAASNLGIPFPDPILTLITLTGAAIPFIRICEEGLVDLKTGNNLDLFTDREAD